MDMDNRINHNKISNTQFGGIKPKANEVKNMDELIKKMVADLLARAEREVPEYGDFKIVYEQFKNPDKSMVATDFMLKITKPPKNIEGHEKKRYLELVAYNLPSPYIAEKVIGHGTKEEILAQLKDEGLNAKIKEKLIQLSKDLEDI